MRVLVLGSGVIGVTSAYYLNRAGHDVCVVDRQPQAAMETSFANGGQISWGAASPWAAPGIPLTALKWMLRQHSPLVLRPRLDPAMWAWLLRMLANCTPARYLVHKERLLRLARYSHECLVALRHEIEINYDARARGTLVLYRDSTNFDAAANNATLLERWQIPYRLLDRVECLAHEPALNTAQNNIAGGIHFPNDESGDCYQFCEGLAQRARANGVKFLTATTVQRLATDGNRIVHVVTDNGNHDADAYVLACGSYSPLLLRPLGLKLPIYPVKGYSLTIPVIDDAAAPQGTLTDETYKVVITRLGDRLRAAGTAELAGYNLDLKPARLATLTHVVHNLFPNAGDFTQATHWAGLRPMTPDSPPIIGVTPYRNLFLNTGHGTLGWTLACGSGKLVADIVSGQRPEIEIEGLTLARFTQ